MSHDDIALAIGVTRNTLEKHYRDELNAGAVNRRLEVLDAMAKTALGGNVSAQKAFLALTAPGAESGQVAPKGKKEQAAAEAKTAADGTDWEDLLPDGKVTPIRRKA